jgi:hypothetical protein
MCDDGDRRIGARGRKVPLRPKWNFANPVAGVATDPVIP